MADKKKRPSYLWTTRLSGLTLLGVVSAVAGPTGAIQSVAAVAAVVCAVSAVATFVAECKYRRSVKLDTFESELATTAWAAAADERSAQLLQAKERLRSASLGRDSSAQNAGILARDVSCVSHAGWLADTARRFRVRETFVATVFELVPDAMSVDPSLFSRVSTLPSARGMDESSQRDATELFFRLPVSKMKDAIAAGRAYRLQEGREDHQAQIKV